MDSERDARDTGWLSLGAETVPLRDTAAQAAERERSERLCLIGKRRWPQPRPRALFCAVLATAALLLLALAIISGEMA